jgi:hypothetical protein
MGASAWNTLQNGFVAVTIVVAFLGASRTLLSILALECLMSNFLAVIALFWSWSAFKRAGRAGLSTGVEEALCQKSSSIIAFGQVYHH